MDGQAQEKVKEEEQGRSLIEAVERCIGAASKGFVIGAGLRGGLVVFAVVARLRRTSLLLRRNGVKLVTKSNKRLVQDAVKETLRYGLFLSAFAGVYTTVDEVVAAYKGAKSAKWRSLVAGAVAGPALLLTGHKTRHTSMALYILMRATVLAARCGIKSKSYGWLCRPLSWKHGDVLLMCISSSQILSAWILKPDSLPASYVSFLNKHGGKDLSIVRGIQELALSKPLASLQDIKTHYYKSSGVETRLDPCMKIPCTMIHADQPCLTHFFKFIGDAYLRSLMVYLPVYLGPAVVVHRQGLIKRPFTILLKTLLGSARSSLFLATYCASAWGWTCLLFRLVNKCSPATLALGTFPTGLALTMEKKSRRMEIALYCFSRAIESLGLCMTDSAAFQRHHHRLPKRIDVVLFSFATAIIMHCYSQERDVFRSKYLNVLDWVFGVPVPIKHSKQVENMDKYH